MWILAVEEDNIKHADNEADGHIKKHPKQQLQKSTITPTMPGPNFLGSNLQSLLGFENHNCDHISVVST